jgi:hypothetical protein
MSAKEVIEVPIIEGSERPSPVAMRNAVAGGEDPLDAMPRDRFAFDPTWSARTIVETASTSLAEQPRAGPSSRLGRLRGEYGGRG